MTECAERATTEAYAARKLTSTDAARAQSHLGSCAACKTAFDQRSAPQDLADIAARLAAAAIYVCIRGDLKAIDRAKLAAIGPVEIVERSALFPP